MSQFCLCGTEPGYPHAGDCPRPLFSCTDAEEARWEEDRLNLIVARANDQKQADLRNTLLEIATGRPA